MPSIKRGMMGAAGTESDAGLFVWGHNGLGQLGDGTTTNRTSPIQVYASVPTDFSGGSDSSAFIKADGTLWTSGLNDKGQLGHGNTTNLSTYTQVGSLTNWASVSFGTKAWVARKTDGTVWACGHGYNGFTDNGASTDYSSPIQIGSDTDWTTVMTAGRVISGFKGTTLYSWGFGHVGAHGGGTTGAFLSPVQIGTGYANGVRGSNGVNQYNNYQVKTDNTIYSAGYELFGMGQGTSGSGGAHYINTYSQIGSAQWTWVCFGYWWTFARRTDGTLYSWGQGGNRLGVGNSTSYSSPVLVSGSLTVSADFRAGGVGSNHGGVVTTSGTLYMWGDSGSGQLGLGNTTGYNTPQQVGDKTDWSKIDAGTDFTMAVRTG